MRDIFKTMDVFSDIKAKLRGGLGNYPPSFTWVQADQDRAFPFEYFFLVDVNSPLSTTHTAQLIEDMFLFGQQTSVGQD